MLEDRNAIKIISKAQQKNVRDPKRNRVPFNNILEDFFLEIDFENQLVIDLGPGHYDFGVLVKGRASSAQVIAIDKDPAVVELGEYLGFKCFNQNFVSMNVESKPLNQLSADGLFCKFSFNAFWSSTANTAQDMLEGHYLKLLKPDGWAWLAPWNGLFGNDITSLAKQDNLLILQKNVFREAGFMCFELPKEHTVRYGIHGSVENSPIFIRGLAVPSSLEKYREF